MSVIEKLDSVLAAIDALKIEAREGFDIRAYLRMASSVERACYDHLRDHGPAIRQDMIDARRLRAYRDATFDGNAVYAALDDRAKSRTSADNVADVLDALNRVARLASDSEGGE